MHAAYQIGHVNGIKDLVALPGATTTVAIDFGKLTTRMRNSVRRAVDQYVALEPCNLGWYSKAKQLRELTRKYCHGPRVFADGWRLQLELLTKSQWQEAVTLIKADLATARLEASQEYKLNRITFDMEKWSKEEYSPQLVYDFNSESPRAIFQEFLAGMSKYYQVEYKREFELMYSIINDNRVVHFQYER